MRVRVRRERLRPEYLLAYMRTTPARAYFRGRAKRTTNLASISSTDLKEMPLPLPDRNIQDEIVAMASRTASQAADLRREGEGLRRRAYALAEARIVGTENLP